MAGLWGRDREVADYSHELNGVFWSLPVSHTVNWTLNARIGLLPFMLHSILGGWEAQGTESSLLEP